MTTYYIDPTTGAGGDGSLSMPFDSWADVTWSAGNTYLQKCGTTFTGAITVGGSGTQEAPITLGKYGVGALPIINANAVASTGCIYATGRAWIDIADFELTGATAFPTAGVHTINTSNISVRRCWIHGNEYGLRYDNSGAVEITNFIAEYNTIEDTEQTGIIVVCGTSVGGSIAGVRIVGNTVRRSGMLVDNNGIHVTTRIASTAVYDATRCVSNLTLTDNIVDTAAMYGIMCRYVVGINVSRNEVTGSGAALDADTHCIWLGGCKNGVVEQNKIHDNFALVGGSSGSGIGIYIDQGATAGASGHESANIIVRRNHIYDQFRGAHSGTHASAAIYVYRANAIDIYDNLIERCRNGIAVRGASTMNSTNIEIDGNTLIDIAEIAVPVGNLADTVRVQNNLVVRAATGFWAESGASAAVNVTRNYNCANDCDTPWATGTLAAMTAGSAGTGDITADPLLIATYRPKYGSPLLQAGTFISYARRDINGVQRPNPPSIGAHDVAKMRIEP